MHFVRLAIISFIVLFLVVFGLSLFIPSHVRVSRAINVKAPKETIMPQLTDPNNWRNWYPGLDSARPMYVYGKVKGMIISEKDSLHPVLLMIDKVDTLAVSANYTGNSMKPVLNTWNLIENASSDSLTLHWNMDFQLRWYPWEKFASLLLEKSYGPKLEQGLNSLKKRVEN